MERKIKVILSTFGPLHLTKSAEFLSSLVDISVIQGWIPSFWNRWILFFCNKIVGRDLYKTFKKRVPDSIPLKKNHSIGFPEFYLSFCRLFKIGNPLKYQVFAAKMYGHGSCKYIHDADVFHVRSGSGAGGAIEKARQEGMKIVVDHSIAHPAFMDIQLREEYKKYGYPFDLGMDNPFWKEIVSDCEKADCLLVNSQFVKDTFVAEGYNADKIEVVLLGVRSDFVGLKKNYNLGNDKLRILFTGGFGFRKGAEYLLRALCKLDEKQIDYEMTVVGDYVGGLPIYERYKPKHITFVNTLPQDELKAYLSESDIYLFPSLCEGCASSGMEALAAGLAVVATKESGLPIEDGVDGIIVHSKDVDAIVQAISCFNSNRKLLMAYGQSASKKIAERYTWEKYADSVKDIYSRILK